MDTCKLAGSKVFLLRIWRWEQHTGNRFLLSVCQWWPPTTVFPFFAYRIAHRSELNFFFGTGNKHNFQCSFETKQTSKHFSGIRHTAVSAGARNRRVSPRAKSIQETVSDETTVSEWEASSLWLKITRQKSTLNGDGQPLFTPWLWDLDNVFKANGLTVYYGGWRNLAKSRSLSAVGRLASKKPHIYTQMYSIMNSKFNKSISTFKQ